MRNGGRLSARRAGRNSPALQDDLGQSKSPEPPDAQKRDEGCEREKGDICKWSPTLFPHWVWGGEADRGGLRKR